MDRGTGVPIVFLHAGSGSSGLWSNQIEFFSAAGYRCIAPDYAGFGRSDKPVDRGWYSYDRHCELTAALLEELDVRDATIVVHDWGGPIGLRLAVEHPDRISRLVVLDTGLFTGEQPMSEAWHQFRDFVERTEDLPVGMLVRGACANDPGDAVIAAYEAPYIDGPSKAGARAFPLILPTEPNAPGAAEGKAVADALREDERPALVLWADSDPVLPFSVGERVSSQLNLPPPRPIADASHFLQEDAGPEIGAIVAEWLGS